jgi:hypothetical protein
MRRQIALWTVLVALTGMVGVTPARADDPGLTVLTFLKLGAGARAAAMGEAYVSVVDDASATYWNPAALLNIPRNDILGVHNEWIQDLRHEFASVGAHRGRHAVGFSFIGLYTDDIEARDETGAFAGHFGFSNSAFGASYAFQINPRLGVGATGRYVRESLIGTTDGDLTLDGFAFDFGGFWVTPVTGVTAAAVLRHLGGQMSYDFDGAQSFDLPTALQAGLSYRRADIGGGTVLVSGDFIGTRGDDASLRFGAEYAFRGQFSLGAGYKTGLDNEDVSFGVGYENRIRVHYAFVPIQNDLGSSHRVSLGYGW